MALSAEWPDSGSWAFKCRRHHAHRLCQMLNMPCREHRACSPMQMGRYHRDWCLHRPKCCIGNDATADHCQKLAEARDCWRHLRRRAKFAPARGIDRDSSRPEPAQTIIDDGFFPLRRTTQRRQSRSPTSIRQVPGVLKDGRNALIVKMEGNCFSGQCSVAKDTRTCLFPTSAAARPRHATVMKLTRPTLKDFSSRARSATFVPGVNFASTSAIAAAVHQFWRQDFQAEFGVLCLCSSMQTFLGCASIVVILIMQNKTAYESRMTY